MELIRRPSDSDWFAVSQDEFCKNTQLLSKKEETFTIVDVISTEVIRRKLWFQIIKQMKTAIELICLITESVRGTR